MGATLNRFARKHCIRLKNAVFYAHHGVTSAESELGNRYEVDVELYLDLQPAGQSDELASTIDYEAVYQEVKAIMLSKNVDLLETLAKKMAESFVEQYAKLESVCVSVRKHNPPIGGLCDYAEINYSLSSKSQ